MQGHLMGQARHCRGVTLLEFLISVVTTSILLVIAVPSLNDMLAATRLRGAVNHFQSVLRYALAESVKRNRGISVSFVVADAGGTWCYGMSEEGGCDCSQAGSCVYDGVERVVSSTEFKGVAVATAVAGARFSFRPRRNTVTAGSVTFIAANGKRLRTVVSGYGRIRSCSPAEVYLGGYPEC